MASRRSTKSEAQVQARDQLDALDQAPEGDQRSALEDSAADQEGQQKDQLKAGQTVGKVADDRGELTVAEQRSGPGARPISGRVDNMTRRDGVEPLEGHFVTLDYENFGNELRAALKESGVAATGEAGDQPNYGVYLDPGSLDPETGYPQTARVQLRDEHAAVLTVPYEAMRASTAGGRR